MNYSRGDDPMPHQLHINLFGAPQVTRGDEIIPIPRRKTLALLAYLTVSAQPQQRETLAAMLWPEHDKASARTRLRRTLSELKQVTYDVFAADPSQVVLHGDLWLDTAAFEAKIAQTTQHNHAPNQFCPDCHTALADAVELYTDDFMAGFTLPDCPAFDEWQFFQAETLRQALAESLQRLIEGEILHNNLEQAIQYARRWVALDSWHEPAHRQLMELYARSGQQAAALRQYELCVELLRDELDVEPAPETITLYEAIKARQIEPAQTEAALLALPAGSVSDHLPPQITPFVGREKELHEIKQLLLTNPPHRLMTLTGPGGIGKTRMALAVGEELRESFKHGVYYTSFAHICSPEQLLPALAESLGTRFVTDRDLQEQLFNHLRPMHTLLILDNMEHLLDASDIVRAILAAAPNVSILTTSRERLNQSSEVLYTLGGLAFPTDQYYEQTRNALDYEAVVLLLQRAQLVRPGFQLTPDNLAAIVRVCQLVQGMPLALVLAGAWLEILSFQEIADEIARNFDFLEAEMRDLPERQSSVRAAFDYSWQRLSLEEQQTFSKLSVFRGGFSREAAEAVVGTNLRTLRTLINKSFVTLDAQNRYEIHELLRQYGEEELNAFEADTNIRACHSHYYLSMVADLDADLEGDRLDEIDAELENINSAWMWAIDHHEAALVAQAHKGLCIFKDLRTPNGSEPQLFNYICGSESGSHLSESRITNLA
jgi:predicted ATPase/DNA-binding SARP family transcriptional activator